jgi:UDPglucose 6-dehydrogenase
VALVTEWKEFRVPAWDRIRKAMRTPVVIDGRNIYDRAEVESEGFTYYCIGR